MHEVVAEPWAAACMDPEDWALWLARNPRSADGGVVDRPCADCPLGFALEMRAEGRCNGTPSGVEDDEEGAPVTSTPAPVPARLERAMAAAARRRLTPIRIASRPAPTARVELELPCAGCVHTEVCSIRELLERTPIRIPLVAQPHPAIGLELRAVATCDHFLADASAPRPAAPRQEDRGSRPAGRPAAEPRTRMPKADRAPKAADLPAKLTSRQAEVLEALQRLGSRAAVVRELGVVYQSVDVMLEAIAKKGLLPTDLPDLPRRMRLAQAEQSA